MLKVKQLSKSYRSGGREYPVLKKVSLEVEKGEFVAVMGPSGWMDLKGGGEEEVAWFGGEWVTAGGWI